MRAIKKGPSEAQGAMLAKLTSSMIDAETATAAMFKVANTAELKAFGLPGAAAFEIPYFANTGKPTGFKRWRYLEDTREGFAAKTDAKPVRYVQAPNTPSELYMPPLVDWAALQADSTQPIVITEGELKALSCTRHVMPCLGLGGVYSFKSTKRKQPLLKDLCAFNWADRTVLIAYDSDAHTNPMVVAARNELCRELLALGARPAVVDITAADDNSKRGLDDIILQDGPDALAEMFSVAEPFAAAAALHELNAEVAYIKDPGMVVVLETGLKMRASDFTGHAYANRHYWESSLDAKGVERMVKKKAAQGWLEWPLRLELRGIVYEPGAAKLTECARYNTWPGWGCVPKRGTIKPWRDLLDHLFTGKPEERSFFERWCALPIQQPGKKMYTAAVLWGVNTGTGKSLVGYSLGRIYGKNFTEIGDSELQDERNEWAVCKQFVMGDDVTGHDQRKYSDKLKKMITQLEMRIDQKYVPSYTVRDVINYLFNSNHPDAFFLEDDDRRNFVHEIECGPLPTAFYIEYMAWLNSTGASHLFDHLLNLDLAGMRAEDRAPNTQARRAMIDDGLSDLGRWVRRLKDDPVMCLKVGDAKLTGDLWAASELLKLYDPEGRGRATAGGVSREMKRAGFKHVYGGMQVRTSLGQQRLFAVRDAEKWLAVKGCEEMTKHYDSTRTMPARAKKF